MKIHPPSFFELYGEEFLLTDAHILNRHYIIIKVENFFTLNYVAKKFENSVSFKNVYGILFYCENDFVFYKYKKGVVKCDFLTQKLVCALKKRG